MSVSQASPSASMAFNLSLIAYDFNYPDRVVAQQLKVANLTKKSNIRTALDGPGKVPIPDLEPSSAELSLDDGDTIVLWVGMRPSDTLAHNMIGKRPAKGRTAGSSVNSIVSNSTGKLLPYDPEALRVVAPINKDNANYYSLLKDGESDICIGYQTPIEEVFLFPEFRDDSASTMALRKATWGKKVREQCTPVQRTHWPRTYDKTKLQVSPERSLGNEICGLVMAYKKEWSVSSLRRALEAAKDFDNNGMFSPVQKNRMLCKLADGERPLNMDEVKEALCEMRMAAPGLYLMRIQPDELQQVSQGLVDAEIVLEYRLSLIFIAYFVEKVRDIVRRSEDLNLSEIATAAHAHSLAGAGPVRKTTNVGLDCLTQYIETKLVSLRELESLVQRNIGMIKNQQGELVTREVGSFAQAWTKGGNTWDASKAKLFASYMHQFLERDMSQVLEPIQEILNVMIKADTELKADMTQNREDAEW